MLVLKQRCAATLVAILAAAACGTANAGISCDEHITATIIHSNGNVYFKTAQTCANNWCEVNWTNTDAVKKATAVLLTAAATGRTVSIYWPNLSSCDNSNVVYASPDYLALAGQ